MPATRSLSSHVGQPTGSDPSVKDNPPHSDALNRSASRRQDTETPNGLSLPRQRQGSLTTAAASPVSSSATPSPTSSSPFTARRRSHRPVLEEDDPELSTSTVKRGTHGESRHSEASVVTPSVPKMRDRALTGPPSANATKDDVFAKPSSRRQGDGAPAMSPNTASTEHEESPAAAVGAGSSLSVPAPPLLTSFSLAITNDVDRKKVGSRGDAHNGAVKKPNHSSGQAEEKQEGSMNRHDCNSSGSINGNKAMRKDTARTGGRSVGKSHKVKTSPSASAESRAGAKHTANYLATVYSTGGGGPSTIAGTKAKRTSNAALTTSTTATLSFSGRESAAGEGNSAAKKGAPSSERHATGSKGMKRATGKGASEAVPKVKEAAGRERKDGEQPKRPATKTSSEDAFSSSPNRAPSSSASESHTARGERASTRPAAAGTSKGATRRVSLGRQLQPVVLDDDDNDGFPGEARLQQTREESRLRTQHTQNNEATNKNKERMRRMVQDLPSAPAGASTVPTASPRASSANTSSGKASLASSVVSAGGKNTAASKSAGPGPTGSASNKASLPPSPTPPTLPLIAVTPHRTVSTSSEKPLTRRSRDGELDGCSNGNLRSSFRGSSCGSPPSLPLPLSVPRADGSGGGPEARNANASSSANSHTMGSRGVLSPAAQSSANSGSESQNGNQASMSGSAALMGRPVQRMSSRHALPLRRPSGVIVFASAAPRIGDDRSSQPGGGVGLPGHSFSRSLVAGSSSSASPSRLAPLEHSPDSVILLAQTSEELALSSTTREATGVPALQPQTQPSQLSGGSVAAPGGSTPPRRALPEPAQDTNPRTLEESNSELRNRTAGRSAREEASAHKTSRKRVLAPVLAHLSPLPSSNTAATSSDSSGPPPRHPVAVVTSAQTSPTRRSSQPPLLPVYRSQSGSAHSSSRQNSSLASTPTAASSSHHSSHVVIASASSPEEVRRSEASVKTSEREENSSHSDDVVPMVTSSKEEVDSPSVGLARNPHSYHAFADAMDAEEDTESNETSRRKETENRPMSRRVSQKGPSCANASRSDDVPRKGADVSDGGDTSTAASQRDSTASAAPSPDRLRRSMMNNFLLGDEAPPPSGPSSAPRTGSTPAAMDDHEDDAASPLWEPRRTSNESSVGRRRVSYSAGAASGAAKTHSLVTTATSMTTATTGEDPTMSPPTSTPEEPSGSVVTPAARRVSQARPATAVLPRGPPLTPDANTRAPLPPPTRPPEPTARVVSPPLATTPLSSASDSGITVGRPANVTSAGSVSPPAPPPWPDNVKPNTPSIPAVPASTSERKTASVEPPVSSASSASDTTSLNSQREVHHSGHSTPGSRANESGSLVAPCRDTHTSSLMSEKGNGPLLLDSSSGEKEGTVLGSTGPDSSAVTAGVTTGAAAALSTARFGGTTTSSITSTDGNPGIASPMYGGESTRFDVATFTPRPSAFSLDSAVFGLGGVNGSFNTTVRATAGPSVHPWAKASTSPAADDPGDEAPFDPFSDADETPTAVDRSRGPRDCPRASDPGLPVSAVRLPSFKRFTGAPVVIASDSAVTAPTSSGNNDTKDTGGLPSGAAQAHGPGAKGVPSTGTAAARDAVATRATAASSMALVDQKTGSVLGSTLPPSQVAVRSTGMDRYGSGYSCHALTAQRRRSSETESSNQRSFGTGDTAFTTGTPVDASVDGTNMPHRSPVKLLSDVSSDDVASLREGSTATLPPGQPSGLATGASVGTALPSRNGNRTGATATVAGRRIPVPVVGPAVSTASAAADGPSAASSASLPAHPTTVVPPASHGIGSSEALGSASGLHTSSASASDVVALHSCGSPGVGEESYESTSETSRLTLLQSFPNKKSSLNSNTQRMPPPDMSATMPGVGGTGELGGGSATPRGVATPCSGPLTVGTSHYLSKRPPPVAVLKTPLSPPTAVPLRRSHSFARDGTEDTWTSAGEPSHDGHASARRGRRASKREAEATVSSHDPPQVSSTAPNPALRSPVNDAVTGTTPRSAQVNSLMAASLDSHTHSSVFSILEHEASTTNVWHGDASVTGYVGTSGRFPGSPKREPSSIDFLLAVTNSNAGNNGHGNPAGTTGSGGAGTSSVSTVLQPPQPPSNVAGGRPTGPPHTSGTIVAVPVLPAPAGQRSAGLPVRSSPKTPSLLAPMRAPSKRSRAPSLTMGGYYHKKAIRDTSDDGTDWRLRESPFSSSPLVDFSFHDNDDASVSGVLEDELTSTDFVERRRSSVTTIAGPSTLSHSDHTTSSPASTTTQTSSVDSRRTVVYPGQGTTPAGPPTRKAKDSDSARKTMATHMQALSLPSQATLAAAALRTAARTTSTALPLSSSEEVQGRPVTVAGGSTKVSTRSVPSSPSSSQRDETSSSSSARPSTTSHRSRARQEKTGSRTPAPQYGTAAGSNGHHQEKALQTNSEMARKKGASADNGKEKETLHSTSPDASQKPGVPPHSQSARRSRTHSMIQQTLVPASTVMPFASLSDTSPSGLDGDNGDARHPSFPLDRCFCTSPDSGARQRSTSVATATPSHAMTVTSGHSSSQTSIAYMQRRTTFTSSTLTSGLSAGTSKTTMPGAGISTVTQATTDSRSGSSGTVDPMSPSATASASARAAQSSVGSSPRGESGHADRHKPSSVTRLPSSPTRQTRSPLPAPPPASVSAAPSTQLFAGQGKLMMEQLTASINSSCPSPSRSSHGAVASSSGTSSGVTDASAVVAALLASTAAAVAPRAILEQPSSSTTVTSFVLSTPSQGGARSSIHSSKSGTPSGLNAPLALEETARVTSALMAATATPHPSHSGSPGSFDRTPATEKPSLVLSVGRENTDNSQGDSSATSAKPTMAAGSSADLWKALALSLVPSSTSPAAAIPDAVNGAFPATELEPPQRPALMSVNSPALAAAFSAAMQQRLTAASAASPTSDVSSPQTASSQSASSASSPAATVSKRSKANRGRENADKWETVATSMREGRGFSRGGRQGNRVGQRLMGLSDTEDRSFLPGLRLLAQPSPSQYSRARVTNVAGESHEGNPDTTTADEESVDMLQFERVTVEAAESDSDEKMRTTPREANNSRNQAFRPLSDGVYYRDAPQDSGTHNASLRHMSGGFHALYVADESLGGGSVGTTSEGVAARSTMESTAALLGVSPTPFGVDGPLMVQKSSERVSSAASSAQRPGSPAEAEPHASSGEEWRKRTSGSSASPQEGDSTTLVPRQLSLLSRRRQRENVFTSALKDKLTLSPPAVGDLAVGISPMGHRTPLTATTAPIPGVNGTGYGYHCDSIEGSVIGSVSVGGLEEVSPTSSQHHVVGLPADLRRTGAHSGTSVAGHPLNPLGEGTSAASSILLASPTATGKGPRTHVSNAGGNASRANSLGGAVTPNRTAASPYSGSAAQSPARSGSRGAASGQRPSSTSSGFGSRQSSFGPLRHRSFNNSARLGGAPGGGGILSSHPSGSDSLVGGAAASAGMATSAMGTGGGTQGGQSPSRPGTSGHAADSLRRVVVQVSEPGEEAFGYSASSAAQASSSLQSNAAAHDTATTAVAPLASLSSTNASTTGGNSRAEQESHRGDNSAPFPSSVNTGGRSASLPGPIGISEARSPELRPGRASHSSTLGRWRLDKPAEPRGEEDTVGQPSQGALASNTEPVNGILITGGRDISTGILSPPTTCAVPLTPSAEGSATTASSGGPSSATATGGGRHEAVPISPRRSGQARRGPNEVSFTPDTVHASVNGDARSPAGGFPPSSPPTPVPERRGRLRNAKRMSIAAPAAANTAGPSRPSASPVAASLSTSSRASSARDVGTGASEGRPLSEEPPRLKSQTSIRTSTLVGGPADASEPSLAGPVTIPVFASPLLLDSPTSAFASHGADSDVSGPFHSRTFSHHSALGRSASHYQGDNISPRTPASIGSPTTLQSDVDGGVPLPFVSSSKCHSLASTFRGFTDDEHPLEGSPAMESALAPPLDSSVHRLSSESTLTPGAPKFLRMASAAYDVNFASQMSYEGIPLYSSVNAGPSGPQSSGAGSATGGNGGVFNDHGPTNLRFTSIASAPLGNSMESDDMSTALVPSLLYIPREMRVNPEFADVAGLRTRSSRDSLGTTGMRNTVSTSSESSNVGAPVAASYGNDGTGSVLSDSVSNSGTDASPGISPGGVVVCIDGVPVHIMPPSTAQSHATFRERDAIPSLSRRDTFEIRSGSTLAPAGDAGTDGRHASVSGGESVVAGELGGKRQSTYSMPSEERDEERSEGTDSSLEESGEKRGAARPATWRGHSAVRRRSRREGNTSISHGPGFPNGVHDLGSPSTANSVFHPFLPATRGSRAYSLYSIAANGLPFPHDGSGGGLAETSLMSVDGVSLTSQHSAPSAPFTYAFRHGSTESTSLSVGAGTFIAATYPVIGSMASQDGATAMGSGNGVGNEELPFAVGSRRISRQGQPRHSTTEYHALPHTSGARISLSTGSGDAADRRASPPKPPRGREADATSHGEGDSGARAEGSTQAVGSVAATYRYGRHLNGDCSLSTSDTSESGVRAVGSEETVKASRGPRVASAQNRHAPPMSSVPTDAMPHGGNTRLSETRPASTLGTADASDERETTGAPGPQGDHPRTDVAAVEPPFEGKNALATEAQANGTSATHFRQAVAEYIGSPEANAQTLESWVGRYRAGSAGAAFLDFSQSTSAVMSSTTTQTSSSVPSSVSQRHRVGRSTGATSTSHTSNETPMLPTSPSSTSEAALQERAPSPQQPVPRPPPLLQGKSAALTTSTSLQTPTVVGTGLDDRNTNKGLLFPHFGSLPGHTSRTAKFRHALAVDIGNANHASGGVNNVSTSIVSATGGRYAANSVQSNLVSPADDELLTVGSAANPFLDLAHQERPMLGFAQTSRGMTDDTISQAGKAGAPSTEPYPRPASVASKNAQGDRDRMTPETTTRPATRRISTSHSWQAEESDVPDSTAAAQRATADSPEPCISPKHHKHTLEKPSSRAKTATKKSGADDAEFFRSVARQASLGAHRFRGGGQNALNTSMSLSAAPGGLTGLVPGGGFLDFRPKTGTDFFLPDCPMIASVASLQTTMNDVTTTTSPLAEALPGKAGNGFGGRSSDAALPTGGDVAPPLPSAPKRPMLPSPPLQSPPRGPAVGVNTPYIPPIPPRRGAGPLMSRQAPIPPAPRTTSPSSSTTGTTAATPSSNSQLSQQHPQQSPQQQHVGQPPALNRSTPGVPHPPPAPPLAAHMYKLPAVFREGNGRGRSPLAVSAPSAKDGSSGSDGSARAAEDSPDQDKEKMTTPSNEAEPAAAPSDDRPRDELPAAAAEDNGNATTESASPGAGHESRGSPSQRADHVEKREEDDCDSASESRVDREVEGGAETGRRTGEDTASSGSGAERATKKEVPTVAETDTHAVERGTDPRGPQPPTCPVVPAPQSKPQQTPSQRAGEVTEDPLSSAVLAASSAGDSQDFSTSLGVLGNQGYYSSMLQQPLVPSPKASRRAVAQPTSRSTLSPRKAEATGAQVPAAMHSHATAPMNSFTPVGHGFGTTSNGSNQPFTFESPTENPLTPSQSVSRAFEGLSSNLSGVSSDNRAYSNVGEKQSHGGDARASSRSLVESEDSRATSPSSSTPSALSQETRSSQPSRAPESSHVTSATSSTRMSPTSRPTVLTRRTSMDSRADSMTLYEDSPFDRSGTSAPFSLTKRPETQSPGGREAALRALDAIPSSPPRPRAKRLLAGGKPASARGASGGASAQGKDTPADTPVMSTQYTTGKRKTSVAPLANPNPTAANTLPRAGRRRSATSATTTATATAARTPVSPQASSGESSTTSSPGTMRPAAAAALGSTTLRPPAVLSLSASFSSLSLV